jgi:multicomponent Na+:H+ antiporter subunit G
LLLDIISSILIFSGVFFFTVGVIGLLRLPDVYTRLHATTKCDTLGAGLILLGLALQGNIFISLKLLLIILLMWVANPTAAHVIAKAAYTSGIPMDEQSFEMDVSSTKGMVEKKS